MVPGLTVHLADTVLIIPQNYQVPTNNLRVKNSYICWQCCGSESVRIRINLVDLIPTLSFNRKLASVVLKKFINIGSGRFVFCLPSLSLRFLGKIEIFVCLQVFWSRQDRVGSETGSELAKWLRQFSTYQAVIIKFNFFCLYFNEP